MRRQVPVHVNIESPDTLKVVDAKGSDVTDDLEFGLGAGDYRLTASRAGFAPIAATFSIQPATEPEKTLDLHWVALPTQLRVILTGSTGTLKVDNVGQSVDRIRAQDRTARTGRIRFSGEVRTRITWNIQFEVKQTSVTIMKPTFQGSPGVSGMAAALSLNSVSLSGH